MKLFKKEIQLQSQAGKATYIDITEQVNEAIKESEIEEGMVTVISPHTTCAVFFEEFSHDFNEEGDEFLQEDLNNVLEKIIPKHDSASRYKRSEERRVGKECRSRRGPEQ